MREDRFRIIQVTDCHLQKGPTDLFKGVNPEARLLQVLNHIQAHVEPYDLLLLTGDLVHHGYPEGYQRLYSYVKELGDSRGWLPGNHDDAAEMQQFALLSDKEFTLGCWSVLSLDSTSNPDGVGSGSIGSEELQWLHGRLEQLKGQHVIIALHHPPLEVGSLWQDAIKLGNADVFLDLVSKYPAVKLMLCGHLHQEHALTCGHISLLATPATAPQFQPATETPLLETLSPQSLPGYRVIDLYSEGEFDSFVQRVSI